MAKAKKSDDAVTITLTRAQARELENSIDGWLDAGTLAPGDRDKGIEGTEREALELTTSQIRQQLYT